MTETILATSKTFDAMPAFDLASLSDGDELEIKTRNSTYTLRITDASDLLGAMTGDNPSFTGERTVYIYGSEVDRRRETGVIVQGAHFCVYGLNDEGEWVISPVQELKYNGTRIF